MIKDKKLSSSIIHYSIVYNQPKYIYGRSILGKVEKILKSSLDFNPSPSPLVKIQIMGGKVFHQ